jgi:hypothetical protein
VTTWTQDVIFGLVMFTAGAVAGVAFTLLVQDAERRRALQGRQ